MSVTATRKAKWQPAPPPPPSPKILNLPRRHRRRRTTTAASSSNGGRDYKEKVEALFERERKFVENSDPHIENGGGGGLTEEKWRFQAEILRAECNFLRMEREFALKKLERNRTQMEKTLKSSVDALVLGRKKIHQGKSVNTVLEEEIEDLEEKLVELQKTSNNEAKIDVEQVQKCSNFDRKTALIQRDLENLDTHLLISKKSDSESTGNRKFVDMESLRRKMEILSRGMLERLMEEQYGSIVSTNQISGQSSEENKCSGQCKSILTKIVEQVRSETEQWSEMQEMLRQVRQEMEELQTSRQFWEDRALDSEFEIRSLHSLVEEWRQKAIRYETKSKDIETELSSLRGEFHKLKKEDKAPIMITSSTLSLGAQIAKEKLASSTRYHPKPDTTKIGFVSGPSRLPFRDIANNSSLSPKVRHKTSSSRGIFCTIDQTR